MKKFEFLGVLELLVNDILRRVALGTRMIELTHIVEEKVVVIHRGRCNNKVYYRLSHDVVT